MPEEPGIDLKKLQDKATKLIASWGAQFGKAETQPVAYGLNALMLTIISDESKGGTDELERQISEMPGVSSIEVTDVRRAIG